MPIPTDWNESEQGYALYIVCGPNSDTWRRNVKGAIYSLTRGRNYDFSTGIFKSIEQLANDMDDSFMTVCMNELIDRFDKLIITQRMLVAALMGESINFDSEPLPNAVNYSQGIRQAILSVAGNINPEMTIQELKDIIEGIDLTGTSYIDTLSDLAQVLGFLFLVFGPDERVYVALEFWDKITLKRWQHNNLSIQAHQATSLRGIMRGITPFKEDSEEDEVSAWDTIMAIPWLAKAVVAVAEPSPVGEIALISTTIGGYINSLYQLARTAWNIWWNKWVNLIEEPEPVDTITAALGVIAQKISTREDVAENPNVSVTNRLDVIAQALEGLAGEDLIPVLTLISEAITALDGLPDGVDYQTLTNQIVQAIGDSMPVINVSCGQCGSSGGCGCGSGGSSGAYGPGVEGPNDSPPIQIVQGQIPVGFDTESQYLDYKCKAANVIVLNIAELLIQISEMEFANLSQYTVASAAQSWIAGKVATWGAFWGGFTQEATGWLSDKIMQFVWPYPSSSATDLGIFADIRLEWLDAREDNVCGVYTSESTSESREFIEETIDGYIDATSYSANTKSKAKEMYKGILSNNFLRREFEKDTMIENYSDSSAIDCSSCLDGYRWDFDTSTEQWVHEAIDQTGGNVTGIYSDGGLVNNINRTTTGNTSGQWIYEGPLLSLVQVGRTLRAEVQGVLVCASGANMAINFDTGPSQSVYSGAFSANGEIIVMEFVISNFAGQIPQSISIESHSGVGCPNPGTYQIKINWVEIV